MSELNKKFVPNLSQSSFFTPLNIIIEAVRNARVEINPETIVNGSGRLNSVKSGVIIEPAKNNNAKFDKNSANCLSCELLSSDIV